MSEDSLAAEASRLQEEQQLQVPWKKWGPYLSERQWGTVREDYSTDGNAWNYFTHDQARSRTYHWGEDGLAGISDSQQRLCFALALWNGQDPILKERLFGLTNTEGNHGEDVKEYYFYLDSTPTHSYMKYLYKYPQTAFPYDDLVRTNAGRDRNSFEYELLDTGIFAECRYFDVFVEYAKAEAEDILIKITAVNRGPEDALLYLLPTLWFRNTWSKESDNDVVTIPTLTQAQQSTSALGVAASHPTLGTYLLYAEGAADLLFTNNETNSERLWDQPNTSPYVKDAFHRYLIDGETTAINTQRMGTKVAALYTHLVPGETAFTIRLRLVHGSQDQPFADFDEILKGRITEADSFYEAITPTHIDDDSAAVFRQALAGMLWSKQYYSYDVWHWLREHGVTSGEAYRQSTLRNKAWLQVVAGNVISMPDKWEYPWFAAWDLAFHTLVLAIVDIQFAKEQLTLLLRENYLHPNGQVPAYEWNFSDVNPPVQAWAIYHIYLQEKTMRGEGDIAWLKDAFHMLMLNFNWWVNREDPVGNNVFEGGFLGLDNIGVFDRSAPLPTGGHLEQADGTSWMAFYALYMLNLALEISLHDPSYQHTASKYFEHFLWINNALDRFGIQSDEIWDETDGFFYDVLRLPDGRAGRLRVRSLVGLLPLAASTIVSPEMVEKLPIFIERVRWLNDHRPELTRHIPSLMEPGVANRRLLAVVDEKQLRRVLARMLDENEFLSPHGIRSISRYHLKHPYVVHVDGHEYRVDYLPAESDSGMFGGNSNWRGPVWLPMNFIVIRGLIQLYAYYGSDFTIECPTGSGQEMTLWEVALEISQRLIRIFLRDEEGHRPVFGGLHEFQTSPDWRDYILFHEYFHGDNGAGLGASHQTGWTGLVAKLIQLYGTRSEIDASLKPHHVYERTS